MSCLTVEGRFLCLSVSCVARERGAGAFAIVIVAHQKEEAFCDVPFLAEEEMEGT